MTVLFSGNNHYYLLTFNNNINSNIDKWNKKAKVNKEKLGIKKERLLNNNK